MNDPVTEAAETTRTFMDVLRREPLSLALVVMNLALLGMFWVIADRVGKTREREVGWMYEEHREVRKALAECRAEKP